MHVEWEEESGIALNAVSEASSFLLDPHLEMNATRKGSHRDLVTPHDYRVQSLIIDKLCATPYPILSEELHEKAPINLEKTHWIVDPIDGTVNFLHGLPLYGISVALSHEGDFPVGAVSIPALREFYFTYGNQGAYLNGRPLTKPSTLELGQALLGCAFS